MKTVTDVERVKVVFEFEKGWQQMVAPYNSTIDQKLRACESYLQLRSIIRQRRQLPKEIIPWHVQFQYSPTITKRFVDAPNDFAVASLAAIEALYDEVNK